jgi:hypothetical protein
VSDGSDQKSERAGPKSIPQHEIDAQALREKTARLRELRLAQGGGGKSTPAANGKRPTAKGTAAKKGSGKARPLSEWLSTQEKEGRRS